MEPLPALLATCEGIHLSPVDSPHEGPVMWTFDIFYYVRLNKQWDKQSNGWWFETPARPCDVIVMTIAVQKEPECEFKLVSTFLYLILSQIVSQYPCITKLNTCCHNSFNGLIHFNPCLRTLKPPIWHFGCVAFNSPSIVCCTLPPPRHTTSIRVMFFCQCRGSHYNAVNHEFAICT